MMKQANFALRGRNPDVLSCIANLSNDEVFTPPEFANKMLDDVAAAWASIYGGANIWGDQSVKFLDPCSKSGVFLREIAARLIKGLECSIPNLEERVNHVLTKQVFGIGITHITSLLARRSLYCSKNAASEHSIVKTFAEGSGNIWFERTYHSWRDGKCEFCGASENTYERSKDLETHAYQFIHAKNIESQLAKVFGEKMQFDVIIGNPPYQLQDAGASASAIPIYQKFIEQALKLEPKFLTMVTPSRWFVGGKGLDEFRANRLSDKHMMAIVDFIVDRDAFPKINVNGGVNYFLWARDWEGDCKITTVEQGGIYGPPIKRSLGEFDVFIRRNSAVKILRKIRTAGETTFETNVSPRKPFGLPTNFFGADKKSKDKNIKLHSSGKVTWVGNDEIVSNKGWVNEWKVLIPRASDGNENYPLPIWDHRGPFVSGPGEACTETYLVASLAKNEKHAERIRDFMRTKFFRFLVSLRKITQDNKSDIFSFVPSLPLDRSWTDEELYARYKITKDEIEFIDTMIRSMEWRSA